MNIALVDQTVYFTRRYDMTEDKTVNGETITFSKVYPNCEGLIKMPSECEGVTAKPGFMITGSWEQHSRWPWQTFVDEGYKGGHA